MKLTLFGIALIIIAIAIFFHQFIVYNIWWEWSDLSHEGWIFMFIFAGIITLWIGRGS